VETLSSGRFDSLSVIGTSHSSIEDLRLGTGGKKDIESDLERRVALTRRLGTSFFLVLDLVLWGDLVLVPRVDLVLWGDLELWDDLVLTVDLVLWDEYESWNETSMSPFDIANAFLMTIWCEIATSSERDRELPLRSSIL
jgi:hypothetical protein